MGEKTKDEAKLQIACYVFDVSKLKLTTLFQSILQFTIPVKFMNAFEKIASVLHSWLRPCLGLNANMTTATHPLAVKVLSIW